MQDDTNNSKRIEYIDFAKGMLILGVIYGHIITALKSGEQFFTFPHAFIRIYDMPLFAFISGLFLYNTIRNHSLYQCLVKKTLGILYPVLLWNVIWDIIVFAVLHKKTLSTDYYWYLWAIFYSSIIVIFCGKIFNKKREFGVLFFCLSICLTHVGYLTKFHVGFILFPCICGFLCSYGYGINFCDNKLVCLNNYWKALIILAFGAGVFFWDGSASIWVIGCNIFKTEDYEMNLLKIFFRASMGISGCFIMFHFFKCLHKFFKKKVTWLNKMIVKYGNASLQMYILQTLIVEQFLGALVTKTTVYFTHNIFLYNKDIMVYVIAPIFSFIAAYTIFKMYLLISKIPLLGQYMFSIENSFRLRRIGI